jgi:hypothetical protein
LFPGIAGAGGEGKAGSSTIRPALAPGRCLGCAVRSIARRRLRPRTRPRSAQ